MKEQVVQQAESEAELRCQKEKDKLQRAETKVNAKEPWHFPP